MKYHASAEMMMVLLPLTGLFVDTQTHNTTLQPTLCVCVCDNTIPIPKVLFLVYTE
jgi:hypothetical protein